MKTKLPAKRRGKQVDAPNALPALRRAATNACKLAIAAGTPFHVWKDGRVV